MLKKAVVSIRSDFKIDKIKSQPCVENNSHTQLVASHAKPNHAGTEICVYLTLCYYLQAMLKQTVSLTKCKIIKLY